MKKYRKAILNGLFFFVLIIGTLYFTLRGKNLDKIWFVIESSNNLWLLLAVACVFIYVCGESAIMKYLLHALDISIPLFQCIRYSFIGFFFSCVTPSASGGQPMQLVYMKKENLKVSESCLVLLIITVGYKAALIVLSGIAFLFQGEYIVENLGSVRYILIYGIVANLIFISAILFLILNESLAKKILFKLASILHKMHMIKDEEKFNAYVKEHMEPYIQGAIYFQNHWNTFFHVLWMSILQRTALFVVPWFVYRSFGLHGISPMQVIAFQTIISLSVDMLPLPGGIGASEKSFAIMFDVIFGQALVIPGMLLSRGISYYLLLLVSGVVTILVHISLLYRQRKIQKEL